MPAAFAVPVNTLLTRRDLSLHPRRLPAARVVVSEALYPKFAKLRRGDPQRQAASIVAGSNTSASVAGRSKIEGVSIRGVYRPPLTTCDDIAFLALHLRLDRKPNASVHTHPLTCGSPTISMPRPFLALPEHDVCYSVRNYFRLWPRQAMTFSTFGGRHDRAACPTGRRPTRWLRS